MKETELTLFCLKTAHSIKDVAFALKMEPDKLFYVVKNTDEGRYYKKFKIPKKNGDFRDISKPIKGLALAQDRLSPVLHYVYNPGPYVKGFVKQTSFIENARYHQNQKWVLNIDLNDFFPSISFPRVRGLFLSRAFGFNQRVATILARLCTFEGHLPQGASTSPVLANMIAKPLDKKLVDIAKNEQLKFTRYSDDITLSSSKRLVPSSVIKSFEDHGFRGEVVLGDHLKQVVRSSGFTINDEKTRLMFPDNRQEVTGLIVNDRANIRRKDISRIRMKIYSVKKFGPSEAAAVWGQNNATGMIKHLIGWLAYIRQVRGPSDPVLAKLCLQAYEAGINDIGWIEELADMRKEFDVFLSHASEDMDAVSVLHKALEAKGITVFFDKSSIKWGDSIVEKVNHGLLKSSFFIPFLTETFAKKGFANKELNSAIQMNISRKGRILPIKTSTFNLGSQYPLLNETLYKVWPEKVEDENAFSQEVSDEILKLVEAEKQTRD